MRPIKDNVIAPKIEDMKFVKIPVIEIPQTRYDELIAKEERLRLIETVLAGANSYDFESIKRFFINKEEKGE